MTASCSIISIYSLTNTEHNTTTASKYFPKENKTMSNNSNNNGEMTQKGREALERFKMESASEMGINLKQGYNGDLTSREAGSIGGRMVQKMISAYKQQ